jgi:hypothetical protein
VSANRSHISTRRERERRVRRNERIVTYGAVFVLVVATAIVMFGLYFTRYAPPRAHVLTVGDSDYNAAEVLRRVVYEMLVNGMTVSTASVVPDTFRVLEDQEIVIARAPAIVGGITEDDVEMKLREQVGITDSGDSAESDFTDALASLLSIIDLSRDEYELVIEVEILTERLDEQFRLEIGEDAEQLRAARIRLMDHDSAEDVRAQLLEGADVTELSAEYGVASESKQTGSGLGWLPLSLFSDAAQGPLADLEVGEVSKVVVDGAFFDVYLVNERDQARLLSAENLDSLIALRRSAWLDEHRGFVIVERDLSDDEEEWIINRLIDKVVNAKERVPSSTFGGGS